MEKVCRLFVVADIHGHYTLLRKALKAAGFDPNHEGHLLICCGDLFDRGPENRKVYDFIRRLPRKVLIRGNHDERLAFVLERKRAELYDLRNGGEMTLCEFFGPGILDNYGRLQLPKYGKMAGILRRFVDSMVDYYETEHYIFTHGWLPLEKDSNVSAVRADWREAEPEAWHWARFLEWPILYNAPSRVPGKTIVCGHRPTHYGWRFDPARKPEDSGIFYGDGMIAIDAGTVRSGQVNVLVLEERISQNPDREE